jgi:hypothetical protein
MTLHSDSGTLAGMAEQRTGAGFVALDEEAVSVEEEGDDTKSKETHCAQWIYSTWQRPNMIILMLVVTVAVTLFGALQSTPDSSGSITSSPYGTHWDASPYRFDFLVTSPYGRSTAPFTKLWMPLYTSHPLNEINTEITSVVICIHGFTRNAGPLSLSLPLLVS